MTRATWPAAMPDQTRLSPAPGVQVLVVEPSIKERQAVIRHLHTAGLSTATAETQDALAIAERLRPPVVVIDPRRRRQTDPDPVVIIRQLHQIEGLLVVAYTSLRTDTDQRLLAAGVYQIIPKPRRGDLLAEVRSVC